MRWVLGGVAVVIVAGVVWLGAGTTPPAQTRVEAPVPAAALGIR